MVKRKKEEKAEELAVTKAQAQTIPTCRSYLTLNQLLKQEGVDQQTLYDQLYKQAGEVIEENNMQVLESMLLSQAQALQGIFHYAAERIGQSANISLLQAYNEVAIKANNACRKTILALHQLKNPSPTTFIKQQNNAINQQVNNPPEAKKSEKCANELLSLEKKSHETMDFGRATTPSRINSKLETMENSRG
ncbi:MAG: uncharacterized protein K0S08_765 [Gammaproteobacteria bacterium]|jgi:hypothetical protein|nr:uncharacterized protein [Gammaproteobacteria bacterium]